jgi:hypothetical protein
MNIPDYVSGRRVTNRGVHLHPFGFHNEWMEEADYWVGLLQSMHMSWVLALSDSDALYISGAAEALLEGGIIPIVRFKYQFPNPWTEMEATEQLVALYGRYNAPCIIQFANEPFDSREWKDGEVPPKAQAWAIISDRWHEAAGQITERDAIAGFPDGPSYGENPFAIIGDEAHHWEEGRAVYLGHYYGKGRPLDFPEDDVSHYGTPLTMEEYRAALDDYADDPAWNEGEHVLGLMNEQRAEWADPSLTPLDDDICWRGWEKVLHRSRETFGFEVQMALTEGGWVPRDRAGSGSVIDIRWPYTTPRMVAEKTLAMYEDDAPLFAICPWLLADEDMGGSGWPFDAWHGWAYSDKYGRQKPVIRTLQENPPPPPGPTNEWAEVLKLARELQGVVEAWCTERGSSADGT